MIQSVNSNTSLTLDKPFAETTATNSNYRILLNTAAHFPSDTAAKVERALEQLSDINEAAINNNRTVTAATKVNGKGINSVMGNLDLNPTSVNANQGGCIYFHYNQSASNTAAIFEHEQGLIRINGDFYLNGRITSSVIRRINFTRGVNSDGGDYNLIYNYDQNDKQVARIINHVEYPNANSYRNTLGMYIYNPTNTTTNNVANLTVGYDQNGAYTYAPTPSDSSNDNNIATTAWVNNFITRGWTIINYNATDIPNNTITNLGSYTFTQTGLYLITYVAYFGNGNTTGTGYRAMYVNQSSGTASQSDRFGFLAVNPVDGQNTYLVMNRFERIYSANTTTYHNVRQNSGSTLSASGGLRIVRIGEAS